MIEGGQWIDGSSIAGFTRIAESDMFLMPDLSTFALLPWESDEYPTARVICMVYNPNGDPFPGDPRGVLYRQLERLANLGYTYKTGPELEFFLFNKDANNISPLPHDQGGYFDYSTDLASAIRKEMVVALEEMGIDVEASHHEVAIGQHEIDFEYGDALATADRAVTFKYVLKAIAQQERAACDLHAETAGGDQRLRHARPPELRSYYRQGQRLRRRERRLWPLGDRQEVHRRSAPSRALDVRA